ncbi:FAD-dependent oxidoreductase [Croceicoccus sediminis]|uniref:FAD-dependent oxidoreductase n=1 Tax=Croceicoccus sediminis TaxID=2571150 RepID=UPI001182DC02|nr:FAD-dependent monooxygenase [Croceicoccus sediminis]
MAEFPETTDVLIVGAGPSGLALACELCRLGVSPVIVDRLAAGANTSRAAVIHARTLEVLDSLGIVEDLRARGVIVPIFRIRDKERILMEADFRSLDTNYPFTLMCPQDQTETVLLNRLEELGGQVLRPVEATAAREIDDEIAVTLDDGARSRVIRTKWLVGCDGAHSRIREIFGIPFEGGSYEESFILADVRMNWPITRDEVSLFFSPDGLLVVAPLPDDRFRIVATVAEAPENPGREVIESLLAQRGVSGAAPHVEDLVWSSRFHIQHRIAGSPMQGRVLLCGDAAHVHSPAGGQGMNTGIQDAVSLADPLRAAIAGGSNSGLTDWAQSRHSIAQNVVETTDRMTRAATLKSGPARHVRNTLLMLVDHIPGASTLVARKLAELDNR